MIRAIKIRNFQRHRARKIVFSKGITTIQGRKEVWKDVPRFERLYQVSNLGRLRSLGRWAGARNGYKRWIKGRIKKTTPSKSGRVILQLWKGNQQRSEYLHRLVLEAFVGPCPRGKEACHFPDPNPANCNLDNLRWDTSKANKHDQLLHGTRSKGEKNGHSKLKASDIPEIKKRYRAGESQVAIGKDYRVCNSTISDVILGRSWK